VTEQASFMDEITLLKAQRIVVVDSAAAVGRLRR